MVLASNPVASVIRLAARPVGAQSSRFTPLAARMRRMALTMVVLPTPGPPVMTRTFDIRASRMAAIWLSASARPVFRSIHGSAFSGSMGGQGSGPSTRRRSRSATTCSARYRPPRKTQARLVDRVGDHRPVGQLEFQRGQRPVPAEPPATRRRAAPIRSVGKPQWPSSIASVSA